MGLFADRSAQTVGRLDGGVIVTQISDYASLQAAIIEYLARDQADGSNPGADYIRVAMVQDKQLTAEALHRLVATLG